MKNETVQFINSLSPSVASHGHSHDHGDASHSHGAGEHGHTHEHLENPGKIDAACSLRVCHMKPCLTGKYAERDLPDYSARNFEERGFTIGIGG